ncbi:heavy-metal-associated domain-containing protein [Aquimarina pacifica]|uniref:heavy-metal-associated domain-containing protein n=1 Tax=Aquimarina pacifica TaxID=1296415 RepID=UPI0004702FEE|nr:heavy metal-associated domain-containing protein [Aquimarina pacifica]
MKNIYEISGMTCQGCRKSVEDTLSKVTGVDSVKVDLESKTAHIDMQAPLSLEALQEVLSPKYIISFQNQDIPDVLYSEDDIKPVKSKLLALKPLLIIFAYLFTSSILLNHDNWRVDQAMFDFMGLFYIVFGFFKIIDLSGFSNSFRMYDPFAKLVPAYGYIYPFIETVLGVLFLMRLLLPAALITTLIILGVTTLGVMKVLLNKNPIKCACLGSVFKLPMTEATLIENIIMIGMAIIMLIKSF